MYLKEFRERLNLTQTELAGIIDIAQTTIARYENDKVKPTSTVLFKYIDKLNANPNFLFLGHEPHLLSNLPELNSDNTNLLNDLTLMMRQGELKEKLTKIFIDEIIQKFEKEHASPVVKLLEIIKMDHHIKTRPFLFLYYIFQLIKKDLSKSKKKISNHRQYLGDIITNYKTTDWKQQPIFTERIKKEIRDFLDVKLTEKECEVLVKNYENALEALEKKMTPTMIKYHRKIFCQKVSLSSNSKKPSPFKVG